MTSLPESDSHLSSFVPIMSGHFLVLSIRLITLTSLLAVNKPCKCVLRKWALHVRRIPVRKVTPHIIDGRYLCPFSRIRMVDMGQDHVETGACGDGV